MAEDVIGRPWDVPTEGTLAGLARVGGEKFEVAASGRTASILGAKADDPYPGSLVPLPLPYTENEEPHWDKDWRLFVPALAEVLGDGWDLRRITAQPIGDGKILRIIEETLDSFTRLTMDVFNVQKNGIMTPVLESELDPAAVARLEKLGTVLPKGKIISPSAPSALQNAARSVQLAKTVVDKGGLHSIVGRAVGMANSCLAAGKSYAKSARDTLGNMVGSPFPGGGGAAAGLYRAVGPYALPLAACVAAVGSVVYMLYDLIDTYRGSAFLDSRRRAPIPEGADGPFAVTALTAAYADCPLLIDRHVVQKVSEISERIARYMLAACPQIADTMTYQEFKKAAAGEIEAVETVFGGVLVADSMEFDRAASKIGETGTGQSSSALMMFSTGGRIMYGDLDDNAKTWIRTYVSNQASVVLISVPDGCVRDQRGNLFDVDTSGTSLQNVTLGRAGSKPVGNFKWLTVTPGMSENGDVSVVLWHVWWEPDKVHLGLQSDLDSYVHSLDNDHADAVDFVCPIVKIRCDWAQPSEYAGLYIDNFRSEMFAGDERCALATVTPLHTGDVIIPREELVRTPGKPYYKLEVNRQDYVPIYLPRGSVSCNGAHPEIRSWATKNKAASGFVSIPVSRDGDADPSPEGTNAVTVLCWGDETAAWVGTRKDLADYLSKGDHGYSKIETVCRVERNPETGDPLPVVGWPKIARAYPVSVIGLCGDVDRWREAPDVDATCRAVVGALAGAVHDPAPRVLPAMSAQQVRNILPSIIVNAQLTVIVLCGPGAPTGDGMVMTGGGVLTGSDIAQAIGIVGMSKTAANDLTLGHPRYVLVVSCVPGMSVSAPTSQYGDPVRLMSWSLNGDGSSSLSFGSCDAFASAICSACARAGAGDTFQEVGDRAVSLYSEAVKETSSERTRVQSGSTPTPTVSGGEGFAERRMDFLRLPAGGGL